MDGAVNSLRDPDLKRAYVRRLFAVVAPRYGIAAPVLSFFRDATWKKQLVSMVAPPQRRAAILDMACGTGDIMRLMARACPAARIVGCDLAPEMARVAAERLSSTGNTQVTLQDMMFLGLKNDSMDLVTGGYALRNAPDCLATLRETFRVLKAGGTAVFLDFSKSPVPAIALLQTAALLLWGGLWGAVLHGRPSIYAYLGRSLKTFPDRKLLLSIVRETGFEPYETLPKMFGLVRIDVFRKKKGESGSGDLSRIP
jgi:demethylmenaquinone methyltransferase / 2-methoxy-6-polyprenyl-1,4-benzoquinol methylase